MTSLARISPEIDEPCPPISYPSGLGWFVVYCSINGEFLARFQLDALGYETYLPVERVSRVAHRRRITVDRPLFSRYLFVGFDPNLLEWGEIKRARGVESILGQDGIPQPVPAEAIERLRQAEDIGIFDRTALSHFIPGERVKVDGGPLGQFIAEVASPDSGNKVEVLHQFLGRMTRMKIDLARCSRI